jgi:hypothetical protein
MSRGAGSSSRGGGGGGGGAGSGCAGLVAIFGAGVALPFAAFADLLASFAALAAAACTGFFVAVFPARALPVFFTATGAP